jgi:malonyl-CoA/methylmalonyl-CoA synthetase
MANHLYAGLLPADRPADRMCMIAPDGGELTYGAVDRMAGRYAAALAASGVKPGDRVLVQVEKSPAALFLYLGCVRCGAAFVPLNTAYTPAEVAYFISDAEPALVVCNPEKAETFAAMVRGHGAGRVLTLDAQGRGTLATLIEAQAPGARDVDRGPSDLAAILYTSGTTGRSKGAMLSHGNLRSNAEALIQTWKFTANDVLIHALPIFHAHGLYVATNVTLMAGGSMIFLPKFDARTVLQWMPRASAMMGVPTFYTRLLDEPGLTRAVAAHMRLFISGSAPLLADTFEAFAQRTGHRILERYGMTETSMNTSNPYDGDRVPGSVGFPLPGVEARVTDPESGRELARDEIGMIEVRGPNVFSGYWRMEEKTRAEFRRDGFFITGDLGKIDARGYVWILGRNKDLVITGGYNVYPKEVELEIDTIPGVLESAVIGLPHADFGEAVTAVVIRQAGATVGEAEIVERLKERLARFKLPKRVVFADELPRNTMAKVQKNVLRDRFRDLYSDAARPGATPT